jgi:hypothetical protein
VTAMHGKTIKRHTQKKKNNVKKKKKKQQHPGMRRTFWQRVLARVLNTFHQKKPADTLAANDFSIVATNRPNFG